MNQFKDEQAMAELYHDDVIKVERGDGTTHQGLEAKKQAAKEWEEGVEEYHAVKAYEPIIAGDTFVVKMDTDITMKEWGRTKMTEIGIFKVRDSKIIREEYW